MMQRYEPKPWDIRRCSMVQDEQGEYVKYDDAKAEITRLTAELAQARAETAAAYEKAAQEADEAHTHNERQKATRAYPSITDAETIAYNIRDLATEPGTTALAEMLNAETRKCSETIRPRLGPQGNGVVVAELHRQADAILARIFQRKEDGK